MLLSINGAPMIDINGRVIGMVASFEDVTVRKATELALEENKTHYQMIFENSGTSNSIFDTECRLVLQNSLSRQQLGKTAEDAYG